MTKKTQECYWQIEEKYGDDFWNERQSFGSLEDAQAWLETWSHDEDQPELRIVCVRTTTVVITTVVAKN